MKRLIKKIMASLEFTGTTVNGDSVDIDLIQDWETLENTWYDEGSDYYGEFSVKS